VFVDTTIGALTEPLNGIRLESNQVSARIAERASELLRRGVKRRDRVFIHYGNSIPFFVDLMACWWLGACVVPIDARLTNFEIETLAAAARPRFSLFDADADTALVSIMSAAGIEVVSDGSARSDGRSAFPANRVYLDDAALILFTSGTTGNPKGVVHTHRSLRARWLALRQSLGTHPYRRALCLLPTHFGHGLICNALFPWLGGADLFIVPPFRADMIGQLGQLIDEHEITFLSSVPSVWTLALKLAQPPRRGSLQRVHCGSAPLSGHLWSGVQEWCGTKEVFNTYGITETGSWIAGTTGGHSGGRVDRRRLEHGHPYPDVRPVAGRALQDLRHR